VLFIDTPRSQRLARVRETRGWSEQDLNAREALQWPLDRKRDRADVRITNEATPEVLDAAVARFWNARIRPHAAAPAGGGTRPPVSAVPDSED
jgi:dephospho-CoA kinase